MRKEMTKFFERFNSQHAKTAGIELRLSKELGWHMCWGRIDFSLGLQGFFGNKNHCGTHFADLSTSSDLLDSGF